MAENHRSPSSGSSRLGSAARVIHVVPAHADSAMADLWIPLRSGSDIVLLGALVRYVLEEQKDFREYELHYTNASVILRDDMRDTEDLDGLFSGWDPVAQRYDTTSWGYAAGTEVDTGYQHDPTLQDPMCLSGLAAALRALHAGDGGARLACRSPCSALAEAFCSASGPENGFDVLRAGLDAALRGRSSARRRSCSSCSNIGRPAAACSPCAGASIRARPTSHPFRPAARLPDHAALQGGPDDLAAYVETWREDRQWAYSTATR